jgi:hypothetical protein
MALLMFYSLTCLSFFRYRSHGFRSLSIYFSIDYYRFQNYRNVGVVFVSDNIVSISFSRKKCENKSDLASYRSFPTIFIPIINHIYTHICVTKLVLLLYSYCWTDTQNNSGMGVIPVMSFIYNNTYYLY